jgi:hypothetical protein
MEVMPSLQSRFSTELSCLVTTIENSLISDETFICALSIYIYFLSNSSQAKALIKMEKEKKLRQIGGESNKL